MELQVEQLQVQLKKCNDLLRKGYSSRDCGNNAGVEWLNYYCAEFLEFTNCLHSFLADELNRSVFEEFDQHVEAIHLCLLQIMTCIKYLEHTMLTEQTGNVSLEATRQHFLDRIYLCLKRLSTTLRALTAFSEIEEKRLCENTFLEVMDIVLDHLSPYSSYVDDSNACVEGVIEDALFDSKQIRCSVDIILSNVLAFANVALQSDKKALSALCQKALRECMAFEEECLLGSQQANFNLCNRKLKAVGLENALYQLEDYINDALLRLVFTCFLDHERLSVERLRITMRAGISDERALDELIADFDVNVDRTTQIGVFAMAFAPNKTMKVKVRSCLASLECLDTCLLPALQAGSPSNLHAEILEQHFNEEVVLFKHYIQEIVDSHAYTVCYEEMLAQCIAQVEKEFNKEQLETILRMGEFLQEHFKAPANRKELVKEVGTRLQRFQRFTLILRECQAIMTCANQVNAQRIIKRFKILRSVLHKFADSLRGATTSARVCKEKPQVCVFSSETSDSEHLFTSIGISPSIHSILYEKPTPLRRRHTVSDSLRGNCSKLPQSPATAGEADRRQATSASANCLLQAKSSNNHESDVSWLHLRRGSLRRKESLRTAMFKRQKTTETEQAYSIYKNSSTSLQISEILDQLSFFSSKALGQKK